MKQRNEIVRKLASDAAYALNTYKRYREMERNPEESRVIGRLEGKAEQACVTLLTAAVHLERLRSGKFYIDITPDPQSFASGLLAQMRVSKNPEICIDMLVKEVEALIRRQRSIERARRERDEFAASMITKCLTGSI